MQDLTDDQIRMHIDFCHPDEIPNTVFTDESHFQIGCDNSWRRMRRGQMDESCFQMKVKFPKGLMVWGGIGINYRTPLMICSTGVDSAEYTKILAQSDMLSEMNSRFGEAKWTLMQDGAPCHTARRTMNWAADNHVCFLPGWPPNSCDLNPIEQIWGIMKHQLRRKRQQSVEDMFTTLQATWYAISDQCINSLVSSFTQWCKLGLALEGKSLSPYLSSHQTVIPSADEHFCMQCTCSACIVRVRRHCTCSPCIVRVLYAVYVVLCKGRKKSRPGRKM